MSLETNAVGAEEASRLESLLQNQLGKRVRDLRVVIDGESQITIQGKSATFYVKMLAQQFVMRVSDLQIRANEIEVL